MTFAQNREHCGGPGQKSKAPMARQPSVAIDSQPNIPRAAIQSGTAAEVAALGKKRSWTAQGSDLLPPATGAVRYDRGWRCLLNAHFHQFLRILAVASSSSPSEQPFMALDLNYENRPQSQGGRHPCQDCGATTASPPIRKALPSNTSIKYNNRWVRCARTMRATTIACSKDKLGPNWRRQKEKEEPNEKIGWRRRRWPWQQRLRRD